MKLWKVLGLAGLAGVAATGVIIARDQRQRTQLTPEDIRARLQERLQDAVATSSADSAPGSPEAPSTGRRGCLPLRRRARRTQPSDSGAGSSAGA
jgi:hypothetical protein